MGFGIGSCLFLTYSELRGQQKKPWDKLHIWSILLLLKGKKW